MDTINIITEYYKSVKNELSKTLYFSQFVVSHSKQEKKKVVHGI